MDLKQLKQWVNSLPEEEMEKYSVVYRRVVEEDSDNWGAYDIPLTASGVDDGNKEVYFCGEESAKILDKC